MGKDIRIDEYPNIAALAKRVGKAVAVIDTETTGLGNPDTIGVVEFAVISVLPDGRSVHYETLVQTQFKLPPAASKVHGIYPKHLLDAPAFRSIAEPIKNIFENRIVAGFNSYSYDAPILRARIDECLTEPCPHGEHLDVRLLYTNGDKYGKGNLGLVASEYGVPVENAHRAMGDVIVTAGILDIMIARNGVEWAIRGIRGGAKQNVRTSKEKISSNTIGTQRRAEPTKPEKTKKEVLLDSLCAVLKDIGRPVKPEDYGMISERLADVNLDVHESKLSYLFGDLVDMDFAPMGILRDESVQDVLAQHLPSFIDAAIDATQVGHPILKQPLMEKLRGVGVETDYVQLRIAINAIMKERYGQLTVTSTKRTARAGV